jgi:hypothetical protein
VFVLLLLQQIFDLMRYAIEGLPPDSNDFVELLKREATLSHKT